MIIIDLAGSHGNAFALISALSNILKKCGKNEEEIDSVVKKMRSGDYLNLLRVFIENCGDYVELVNINNDIEDQLQKEGLIYS